MVTTFLSLRIVPGMGVGWGTDNAGEVWVGWYKVFFETIDKIIYM